MKKRTIFLSLILLYLAFSIAVFCMFFSEFLHIFDLYIELYPEIGFFVLFKCSSICLFCIFSIALCLLQLIMFFKKTSVFYFAKYTYEQYKEMRQNRKAEKIKLKQEKLQKELNEIEKDTK